MITIILIITNCIFILVAIHFEVKYQEAESETETHLKKQIYQADKLLQQRNKNTELEKTINYLYKEIENKNDYISMLAKDNIIHNTKPLTPEELQKHINKPIFYYPKNKFIDGKWDIITSVTYDMGAWYINLQNTSPKHYETFIFCRLNKTIHLVEYNENHYTAVLNLINKIDKPTTVITKMQKKDFKE